MARHFAAGLLLLANLPAQMFVVDAANGPGTHFTSLPAAVAAVPDGAVLSVRIGAYSGFRSNGKGLRILAETNATLTSPVSIGGTLPHQPFVLAGFAFATGSTTAPLLTLANCAGLVLLESMVTPRNDPACIFGSCWPALSATGCSQLIVRSCSLGGKTSLDGTTAVIEGSVLHDVDCILCTVPAGPTVALRVNRSTVQIAGSQVLGGDGGPNAPSVPPNGLGLSMSDSHVRVERSTVSSGISPLTPQSAIYFLSLLPGSLRLDPATRLVSVNSPAVVGIVQQIAPMPGVSASSAPVGGTIGATVATETGDLVILILGLPGAPTLVPGFADAFWLDPVVHGFAAIGVQTAAAPVQGSLIVPNLAQFLGTMVVWHAVAFGPVTGQQDSNPAFSLVR